MMLDLRRRPSPSHAMRILSPVLALLLTVLTGLVLFALYTDDSLRALYVYFVSPLTTSYGREELLVKASPLIMIGVGLAICYRANAWNIGAEGQLSVGALTGGAVALALGDWDSGLVLPIVLVAGAAGGLVWALVPALLKARFNASEILTSLMLVYVAQLLLDYMVRGPLRDPGGFNFPESALLSSSASLPILFDMGRLHAGLVLALLAAVGGAVFLFRTVGGFEIRVAGQAPRAAAFGGFSNNRVLIGVFALSGALAGLAGICEVAGPIGQLLPSVSPGYGFTAIIVAFLGRLDPLGVVLAALLLALSYLGGEAAQMSLGLPRNVSQVMQGVLLFWVLACDTFILYRVRFTGMRTRTA